MVKQVLLENEEQIKFILERSDIRDIILSIDTFSKESIFYFSKKIVESGKNMILRLERIRRKDDESYEEYINNENIKGFLVENIDSFYKLMSSGIKDDKLIELDYTMNIWNEEAKSVYDRFQKIFFTYPIELSAYDMRKLKMDTLLVYTSLPVMISANCPFKTEGKCDGRKDGKVKIGTLKDRKNKKVYYKSYCKYCYSKIFNPDFYYIADILKTDKDIKNLDFRKVRYEFSLDESLSRMKEVLDTKIDTSEKSKENFTRGHIRKSIQ